MATVGYVLGCVTWHNFQKEACEVALRTTPRSGAWRWGCNIGVRRRILQFANVCNHPKLSRKELLSAAKAQRGGALLWTWLEIR